MCLLLKVLEVIGLDSLEACSELQELLLSEADLEGIVVIEELKRALIPNFDELISLYQMVAKHENRNILDVITEAQAAAGQEELHSVLEELCVIKNFFIEDGFFQSNK